MAFKLTAPVSLSPLETAVEEVRATCTTFIQRLDRRDRSPIREDREISDPLVRVVHRLGRVLRQTGWYPTSDIERVADALVDCLPSHSYVSKAGEFVQGSYGDSDKAKELRKVLYEGFGLPVPTGDFVPSQEAWANTEVLITSRADRV